MGYLIYSRVESVDKYAAASILKINRHTTAVRSQSVHGTVWQLTECDNTRYCTHTILVPPEDEHSDARNMLRSVM